MGDNGVGIFVSRYGDTEYCFYEDHLTVDGVPIRYSEMRNIDHLEGDEPAYSFDYGDRRFTLPYDLQDRGSIMPYFVKATMISPLMQMESAQEPEAEFDPEVAQEPVQTVEPEFVFEPEPESVQPTEAEFIQPADPAEPEFIQPAEVAQEPVQTAEPEFVFEPDPEPAQTAEPEFVQPAEPVEAPTTTGEDPISLEEIVNVFEEEFTGQTAQIEPVDEVVEPVTEPAAEPEPEPQFSTEPEPVVEPEPESQFVTEPVTEPASETVAEPARTKASIREKLGGVGGRIRSLPKKTLLIIGIILALTIIGILAFRVVGGQSIEGLDDRVKLTEVESNNGYKYKVAVVNDDANVEDFAIDYYKKCFKEGDELQWVINKATNQTILFADHGDSVLVITFTHIEGEEEDPNILGSGRQLDTWMIYPDRDEIIRL